MKELIKKAIQHIKENDWDEELVAELEQEIAGMGEPYGYAYVTDAENGWTRTDFSLIRDIGMLEIKRGMNEKFISNE